MADILNVDINSATSSYTKARITSYSAVPRTDTSGTRVTLGIRVTMGSGSALYTHSSDQSYGRVFKGTLNGHSIGTHILKQYNTDRWENSTAYNYSVTFDIPYSTGPLNCAFTISPQGSGAMMTTSTFSWGTTSYQLTAQTAVGPGQPTNIKLGGVESLFLANLGSTYNLTWTAPVEKGTSGIQHYAIYRGAAGQEWEYVTHVPGGTTSLAINTASHAVARGQHRWFTVVAVSWYASGWGTGAPAFYLLNLPTAPASMSVQAATKVGEVITMSWPAGASDPHTTVSRYVIEVRHLAKGSSTWSAWTGLTTTTGLSITTTPTAYSAWAVVPGSQLQYRVFTESTGNALRSPSAASSGVTLIKGGLVRVKVSGSWREGIAYVRVAGSWREASSVYIKARGVWREGV